MIVLSYLSVGEIYKLKKDIYIDIMAWCKMVKDIKITMKYAAGKWPPEVSSNISMRLLVLNVQ